MKKLIFFFALLLPLAAICQTYPDFKSVMYVDTTDVARFNYSKGAFFYFPYNQKLYVNKDSVIAQNDTLWNNSKLFEVRSLYETVTGFGNYNDTTYTEASPRVVTAGTTDTLRNFAQIKREDQLPTGIITFYDSVSNRIIPPLNGSTDGDFYVFRVTFKAKSSNVTGSGIIKIDIGGTQGIISQRTFSFPKGTNIEHPFSFTDAFFTGDTFIANGGIIEIEAVTGDISVYDINFLVGRIHKGR